MELLARERCGETIVVGNLLPYQDELVLTKSAEPKLFLVSHCYSSSALSVHYCLARHEGASREGITGVRIGQQTL